MKTIDSYNFKDKKAIVRVDFNVPLDDQFKITDDSRMKAAVPTIKKIIDDGGAAVLMSHLGRPKGAEEKFSLKHLLNHLSELLGGVEVKFAKDCIGEEAREQKKNLKPGEVLILENLRFHGQEKKGDEEFAKELAEGMDVYVNDAFGTAHREHASTAVIARYFSEDKMFGYIIESELESVDKVLKDTKHPFTAIMGGAKVSGKIEIIENLLDKVDNLLIGGGMTYTFIKAQGGNVGSSKYEEDKLDLAKSVIEKAKANNVNLVIPSDNVVADDFANEANTKVTKTDNIDEGWMGLDIADETIRNYQEIINNSATLLWNGPMGVFEMENFQNGTIKVAQAVAEASRSGAFSLVGGGDSVAAVNKFSLEDDISYVSTGGGALLEYIEGKELPGIKAIRG